MASVHGVFSYIQHLHIQRKTSKKFNFKLSLFSVPYDIQLLLYFKESRRLFFFFMTVMFQVTVEGLNITIRKCSSIFDTCILIENLLPVDRYDIYGITLVSEIYPWLKFTIVNSFVSNAPFLDSSENKQQVFSFLQGVEKVCIGNKWVNIYSIFKESTDRICQF